MGWHFNELLACFVYLLLASSLYTNRCPNAAIVHIGLRIVLFAQDVINAISEANKTQVTRSAYSIMYVEISRAPDCITMALCHKSQHSHCRL